jgi:hypothetical protein
MGALDVPTWTESNEGSAYATPIALVFAIFGFLYRFQKGFNNSSF